MFRKIIASGLFLTERLSLKAVLPVLVLLFSSLVLSGQDQTVKQKEISKEKVYLHLDKPYYASGEDLWFKIYLVDAATLKATTQSKIVHVDLIGSDKKIIDSRSVHMGQNGGSGHFTLPSSLASGQYLLRAYTNYMRNFDQAFFFRKTFYIDSAKGELPVSATSDDKLIRPDFQFFPEGGNMVESVTSWLGFKVLGSDGRGIHISGEIVDQNGKKVMDFQTSKFGMGRILFTPESGKKYIAKFKYSGESFDYELSGAMIIGVTILVEDFEDHYQILVQSTLDSGVNGLLLIAQQEGHILGKAGINGSENFSTIKIPKSIFKEGIIAFTVVDKDKKPWCERLVFNETGKKYPNVRVSSSKPVYGKKEKVTLNLTLENKAFKSVTTNMSVAVTDMNLVKPGKYGLDIRSWMLLNSELKGKIESPGYYFLSQDPQRSEMLDILMMIQGWRRYLYADQPGKGFPEFKPETGIRLRGIVKKDNLPLQHETDLVIRNRSGSFSDTVRISQGGYFELGDYNITDSTTIIFKLVNPLKSIKIHSKSSKSKYDIAFEPYKEPKVSFRPALANKKIPEVMAGDLKTYVRELYRHNVLKKDDNVQLEEIELSPVQVSNTAPYKEKKRALGMKHTDASYTVTEDQVESSAKGDVMSFLQNRIPGLEIRGQEITLRGRTTIYQSFETKEPERPLFILDNMAVDFEAIRSLRVESIDFVEVLKGSRAAIYGGRAGRGVIAIYTKNYSKANNRVHTETHKTPAYRDKNEIMRFVHPGFYKSKEFYSPKYTGSEKRSADFRTTIYWNPEVELNTQGKATITFFTADQPSKYRIDLQGITLDGVPVVSEFYLEVQ